MLNLGYNNQLPVDRVIAIVSSDSAPIKRLINSAREKELLHDCTEGKKTRSAVIATDDSVYLSAFTADSLSNRLEMAYLMSKVVNEQSRWVHPDYKATI